MDLHKAQEGIKNGSFSTIEKVEEAYRIIRDAITADRPDEASELVWLTFSELEKARKSCCARVIVALSEKAMAEEQYSVATEANFAAVDEALKKADMNHKVAGVHRRRLIAKLKWLRLHELKRLWGIAYSPGCTTAERSIAIDQIELGFDSAIFARKMIPHGYSSRALEDLVQARKQDELGKSRKKINEKREGITTAA